MDSKKLEEKLLRFAAPALYQKMVDIFSDLNIHSYDVHGTAMKKEHGLEVTLRFSANYIQEITTYFSMEQVQKPDEEVEKFFKETAEKCKSQLIADYYKMIKL
jgi:UDP-3-O-acyl-N-acetylglucosamine deacetylase